MKMKTSPQHFQWILRGTALTPGGVTFNDGYLIRITMFLLSALWTLATRRSAAAPLKIYVWVL